MQICYLDLPFWCEEVCGQQKASRCVWFSMSGADVCKLTGDYSISNHDAFAHWTSTILRCNCSNILNGFDKQNYSVCLDIEWSNILVRHKRMHCIPNLSHGINQDILIFLCTLVNFNCAFWPIWPRWKKFPIWSKWKKFLIWLKWKKFPPFLAFLNSFRNFSFKI